VKFKVGMQKETKRDNKGNAINNPTPNGPKKGTRGKRGARAKTWNVKKNIGKKPHTQKGKKKGKRWRG